MEILFTNTIPVNIEQPKPASKFIPEWYKNTRPYIENHTEKNLGMRTIKRCIPVLDSLTSGYIITCPADVMVTLKDGPDGQKYQFFQWSACNLIDFHPIEQAPQHPMAKPYQYPKFNNPWSIKTPKGYSTLFVQPFHRDSIFTILPGIVDTDMYTAPVNFPFVLNDPNFEGLISQGTPIAQVIPIKRDKWSMAIGNSKDYEAQDKVSSKLQTRFFDRYKTMFWGKKEYK